MNPQFFGQAEAPLYGVYLPPKATPRDAGVVLCYPFGQEYMRAHRAYRQLALLLTKKGYHVLRFDYRGTGDSSGELDTVVAQDWVDDVGLAVHELRESAGVKDITVIGLRLGALIAGTACAARTDIERLILWDPILDGSEYERELLNEIANEKPSEWGGPTSGNLEAGDGSIHFNGFRLTRQFRDTIKRLSLRDIGQPRARHVLQVVSHETPAFVELKTMWCEYPGYRYQLSPAPHDWNYVDNFGGILLPQPVIQSIVSWMD
ncbi:MAG TPA: alpha/beta fold hydrolase [Spongiibacteraceae bacterium]